MAVHLQLHGLSGFLCSSKLWKGKGAPLVLISLCQMPSAPMRFEMIRLSDQQIRYEEAFL